MSSALAGNEYIHRRSGERLMIVAFQGSQVLLRSTEGHTRTVAAKGLSKAYKRAHSPDPTLKPAAIKPQVGESTNTVASTARAPVVVIEKQPPYVLIAATTLVLVSATILFAVLLGTHKL